MTRLMAILLFLSIAAHAAAESLNLEDVLRGLDDAQLQDACRDLQREFQGQYVLQLAPLRDAANALLPLLDQDEETKPYAAWLRTRLDYLAVADELRLSIPAPQSNPSADIERHAWQERLKLEPLPVRAEWYVAKLKPVFVEERVPPALVWLAEVESGFDPRARSPSGAMGLFQLMPETANWLGLASDHRLQPEKNARAAARYLKYLHDKFNDWRLTVAAYNAGEGTVRRLLDKHTARKYDDIAVYLPAETQMYVPKVEATILRREGVVLNQLK